MLSIGGRATLIKASLLSLTIYYMSLFPIPKGVLESLTKIQRNFMWNNSADRRHLPLASWSLLELPKCLGGLNMATNIIGTWIHFLSGFGEY